MLKFYRYFFFQFYKLAKHSEKQWAWQLRTPELLANMTFSVIAIMFAFPFVLLADIPKKYEVLPIIILFSPSIIVFVYNYFFIINTRLYELDEQEFTNESDKVKLIRKASFFLILFLVVFLALFVGAKTKNNSDVLIYKHSKELKVGMPLEEFLSIMESAGNAYNDDPSFTIYYYEINVEGFCGIDVVINKEQKIVQKIEYKKY